MSTAQPNIRVLQVVTTISPKMGGSVEACRLLTNALSAVGAAVDVVALESADPAWKASWNGNVFDLGGTRTKYRYTSRLRQWLREHGREYNVAMIHGLWRYTSVGAAAELRSCQVPFCVFPHGMLDPYFKTASPLKHWIKYACWKLYESKVLSNASAAVFLAEEERLLARESFGKNWSGERVLSFGIEPPPQYLPSAGEQFFRAFPQTRSKRIMLFLGRIHPKKGADLLIRGFAAHPELSRDYHVVMVGPDEQGTKAELCEIAETSGISNEVIWIDHVEGALKWGAFEAADVFVLPSHQENFGLTLVEAMACGVPVITTNRVNIWREIEQGGAGLITADSQNGVTATLQKWVSMPATEKDNYRRAALKLYQLRYSIATFSQASLELAKDLGNASV